MTFLIQQTLIYAVPLMIVALAGVFAERSGIINLALEGIMIFGAFAGVLFVNVTQKAGIFSEAKAAGDWVALQGFMLLAMLVAAILGAVFSLLLSFASVNLKADQTIGGTALNLMAPALVLFFIRIIANQNTLQMAEGDAASWFMLKKSFFGYGRSDEMGFFGDTFINKAYLATYICIILFVVLSILLYKTRFGLRLRSCGENPQAADSLGINVYVMRYAGTTISGALAGMGGFVYALTTANCASTGDVAGFGFLALAVDLRQLETFEHRRRGPAVRPVQVHRRLLCQHRHQRRRCIPAGRARHQPPLLPDAALYYHAGRSGLHLQEVQGSQGGGHPLRQGKAVTEYTCTLADVLHWKVGHMSYPRKEKCPAVPSERRGFFQRMREGSTLSARACSASGSSRRQPSGVRRRYPAWAKRLITRVSCR